ncbi:MAG: hypothetical protein QM802_04735 [Agriterribacter sp.]
MNQNKEQVTTSIKLSNKMIGYRASLRLGYLWECRYNLINLTE